MKTFKDLQPGDKLFEIFSDKTIGIYEVKYTVCNVDGVFSIFIYSLIGNVRQSVIRMSYTKANQTVFYNSFYSSWIYINEQTFLNALKNYD